MFISKIIHLPIPLSDSIIKRIARVVPVLNGRDSDGKPKYLGPEATKIYRYLLVLWGAKSEPMFRLREKEIDNLIYFTLYALKEIANSFKDISPYHLPINYDRSKVAIKVYNMISNNGLVDIKKIDGDTYITVTEKGEDVSDKLLRELIAYEEFANMNKTDSEAPFKVKKGVKSGVVYDPGLQRVESRLAEKISEINLPFEEELKTIEED
jgi:predicted transcriptional regulator